MSIEIFLLGLDQIGTSIGLALSESELDVIRVGYDTDRQRTKRAQDLGAVDRLVSHPRNAPTTAEIVILDVPAVDVPDYIEMLASNLKAEGMVIDTTPTRLNNIALAKEHLPDDRSYVGATMIIGPDALLSTNTDPEPPRADLFKGGLVALVLPPDTPQRVVTASINFATLLGATPFFLDAYEHDGVSSYVDGLPAIISAALMHLVANASNWRDIQRMGGAPLAQLTGLCAIQPPDILETSLAANRENLLARIEALIEELHNLRAILNEEDAAGLENYLAQATNLRESWLAARKKGDWAGQESKSEGLIVKGSLLGNLLGFRPREPKKRA